MTARVTRSFRSPVRLALEELGAQRGDARVVDPGLELGVRVLR